MKMVNTIKQFAAMAVLGLLSTGAMAIPITGSIDMGGAAYVYDQEGGQQVTDASLATFIDFNPNKFRVVAASDDFSPVLGSIGEIKDLSFGSFAGPLADFWTVGNFSFELTDVVRGTSSDEQRFLVLNGSGVISANGFDDTIATWSFTADTTGNGAFVWNAISENVPEPGMLALLSIGLIAFGLRRKSV
ncbi:MAG TPA: PEP-CTERM sorting domain-containing protein [Gammaproteobacteria bacterium]|nr:PEP-CTERM sorting domain-containing protein [Gammaproteobacteria bacterium]